MYAVATEPEGTVMMWVMQVAQCCTYLWHNGNLVQDMRVCMLLQEADNLISLDTKIQSLCNALTCQGSNKQVRQPALSTHKQPQDGNLQF